MQLFTHIYQLKLIPPTGFSRKMKQILSLLLALSLAVSSYAQEIEVTGPRKAVRTSGDIGAVLLPVAGLTAILVNRDWQGLKQGALAGITTLGATYILKYAVKKERPDKSDMHSFPSMHTSVSFTAAGFIQRRYGWKWGIPAYVVSTYVGWSRYTARNTTGGMWRQEPSSVWEVHTSSPARSRRNTSLRSARSQATDIAASMPR